MEESFEKEVQRIWDDAIGDIFAKLECVKEGFRKWAANVRRKRKGNKKDLTKKLGELLEREIDDDSIVEIIDTKIHLNFEIDRDELY